MFKKINYKKAFMLKLLVIKIKINLKHKIFNRLYLKKARDLLIKKISLLHNYIKVQKIKLKKIKK